MNTKYSKHILITLVFALALPFCWPTFAKAVTTNSASINHERPTHAPQPNDANVPEGDTVKITTRYGDIIIRLYGDTAPNTVANFKALAASGFYDGLTFHRVVAGFMAQGGDPDGNGKGGPGYTIKYEYNIRIHIKGSVAMARKPDLDSAGSQFYICYAAQPRLDGQYTVFGQVIQGMDVVNKIKKGDTMLHVAVMH